MELYSEYPGGMNPATILKYNGRGNYPTCQVQKQRDKTPYPTTTITGTGYH